MTCKKLKVRDLSFHVTGRTSDRVPFDISIDKLWDAFTIHLNILTLSHRIRLRAFVLMDNHFHLLVSSDENNVEIFKKSLQQRMNRMLGKDLFESFHSTEIKSAVYYQYAYKYVLRNPVSAGLCQLVQDYPYTTINSVLGRTDHSLMIFDNMNLVQDSVRVLGWLNQPSPYPPEIEELNLLFG